MKILLTNDDGVQVEVLKLLADALGGDHEVRVIAPDGNRSGQSMAITLHDHLKVKELKKNWYSCSGTPTDCVLLASLGALGEKPDLILSGINYGPNLGTDILYSGTAAAAREGAIKGIPSMALSLNQLKGPWKFEPLVDFVVKQLDFLCTLWKPGYFLNINFPEKLNESYELLLTKPCHREYKDDYKVFQPPKGPAYYFPYGFIDTANAQEGSDLQAVLQGNISISPISTDPMLYPEHHEMENKIRQWEGRR